MKQKIYALAAHLGCTFDEILASDYHDQGFEYGSQEYLVLTDDEADVICEAVIRNQLWTFRASFLASYMNCYESMDSRNSKLFIESIESFQSIMCESCNGVISSLLGNNVDSMIQDAIGYDGRGHFLAQYDGQEIKQGDYYIYRIN